MLALIITGDKHSGKSSFTKILCSRILGLELGTPICGLIQVPPLAGEEQKEWYLCDMVSGEERLLLTTIEREGWPQRGRFWINQATFEWANERLLDSIGKSVFLVIDEIGPLELEGGGYHEALSELRRIDEAEGDIPILIVVVRRELVDAVIERYSLEWTKMLDTSRPWEEEFGEFVY
ncbi:MAG: nucleoside-triphosphatase [Sphaerochaetaceae bacterium]|jgi:nucleoside-triphosphatase THEP1|nr:nucleoside-triphosphatase [Sphaerochaetaceae bacterium]HHU88333.1 hypothetical protein [Spirochaetales bacterium]